nr:hypothetical protein BaRGS_034397 [Batillaria attramentaria]
MLRDTVKNSLQLKLVTEKSLGLQKVGGKDLEPKSLEDVMIVGARRILHLQQLMTQAALKTGQDTAAPNPSSASDVGMTEEK